MTDRAVNKVTQRVKQQRVQREKKVFRETAVHQLDNADGDDDHPRHLSVGRQEIQDARSECRQAPALRRRGSGARRVPGGLAQAGGAAGELSARPATAALSAAHRSQRQQLHVLGRALWRFRFSKPAARGLPGHQGHVDAQSVEKKVNAYGQSFDGQVYQAFTIEIPENYKAISGYIQRTNFRCTRVANGRSLEVFIGDRYFFRFATDDTLNQFFSMNGESGTLPVTLSTASQLLQFNYAIGINCRRMDKALEQWQLKTHAAIMAGLSASARRVSRPARAVPGCGAPADGDGRQSRTRLVDGARRAEESFHPPSDERALPAGVHPDAQPDGTAARSGLREEMGCGRRLLRTRVRVGKPHVRLLPLLLGAVGALGRAHPHAGCRSGVRGVPACRSGASRRAGRPGFEAALAHYHETGDVWMGEEIPDMFSNLYVSIIAEIKARNALPDDEICLGEWDVRLPTTLVMLKEDDKLPEWKPEKECIPPPEE